MKIFKHLLPSIKTFEGPEEFQVEMKKAWEDYPTDRVLYLHLDEDDLPYYVGYGSEARSKQVGKIGDGRRNDDWHTVHDAHGLRVEILLSNLHEHCAIVMEQWLIAKYIKKYGRFNEGGLMTNRSLGGYGSSGYQFTEEQRRKCSGELNGMHGKGHLISGELNGMHGRTGELHPTYGRTGELNPMYGKGHLISGELNPMYGNGHLISGELHPNFKGYSIGVNAEQFVILAGGKEMKDCGFHQSNISKCISGRMKSHKGFTWTRHSTLNYQDFLHLKPFNELSRDRVIDAMPEEVHLGALDEKEFLAYALFT